MTPEAAATTRDWNVWLRHWTRVNLALRTCSRERAAEIRGQQEPSAEDALLLQLYESGRRLHAAASNTVIVDAPLYRGERFASEKDFRARLDAPILGPLTSFTPSPEHAAQIALYRSPVGVVYELCHKFGVLGAPLPPEQRPALDVLRNHVEVILPDVVPYCVYAITEVTDRPKGEQQIVWSASRGKMVMLCPNPMHVFRVTLLVSEPPPAALPRVTIVDSAVPSEPLAALLRRDVSVLRTNVACLSKQEFVALAARVRRHLSNEKETS